MTLWRRKWRLSLARNKRVTYSMANSAQIIQKEPLMNPVVALGKSAIIGATNIGIINSAKNSIGNAVTRSNRSRFGSSTDLSDREGVWDRVIVCLVLILRGVEQTGDS
jgi:hypothetical protein